MITTAFFNAGIIFVPLVTATTIMFLTPIITTVLSVLVLQEHVGIRRWAGVAVGFIGAVIVVQPWTAGTASFNIGMLFLLAASVSNASYQIATRTVRDDHPLTSLLFTATFGAVIASLIFALVLGVARFNWLGITSGQWIGRCHRPFLHHRGLSQRAGIGGFAVFLQFAVVGSPARILGLGRHSTTASVGRRSIDYRLWPLHFFPRTKSFNGKG